MTPQLDRADIDRIHANHRIVDVLSRIGVRPPARWNGTSDFMISCPTPGHRDSTPSCIVHPGVGRWHCFGCGAHGDVLDLVSQTTGLRPLREIADLLDSPGPIHVAVGAAPAATTASLALAGERPDPVRTSYERVMAANTEAWRYLTQPGLARRARTYLASRGIDLTALQAEAGGPLAGHTPYRPDGLASYLLRLGFSGDEIVDAGWATRHDETLTDRFRRRVIIPVRDADGQIIGAYGRDVTGRATCKYLNTPHTIAFHKGAALYRPTVEALDPDATVIVCEGSLDALAIAAHAATAGQSPRCAPVSPSGTALTDAQARLVLGISAMPPVVCADGDAPGLAASATWASTLIRPGRETLVTVLPDGHDPASWLTEHGAAGLAALTRPDRPDRLSGPIGPVSPGGLLAEEALTDHVADARRRHPDTETVKVLPAVLRQLAQEAAALPEPARRRFAAAAGTTLAHLVDGMSAAGRARQVLNAIERRRDDVRAAEIPIAAPGVLR